MLPKLDRVVHGRARLGILSALAVNDTMSFNELKELLDVTDGICRSMRVSWRKPITFAAQSRFEVGCREPSFD